MKKELQDDFDKIISSEINSFEYHFQEQDWQEFLTKQGHNLPVSKNHFVRNLRIFRFLKNSFIYFMAIINILFLYFIWIKFQKNTDAIELLINNKKVDNQTDANVRDSNSFLRKEVQPISTFYYRYFMDSFPLKYEMNSDKSMYLMLLDSLIKVNIEKNTIVKFDTVFKIIKEKVEVPVSNPISSDFYFSGFFHMDDLDFPPAFRIDSRNVESLEKLIPYIQENFSFYSISALSRKSCSINIELIITKNGTIEGLKFPHSMNPEAEMEVVKILKSIPGFIPGSINQEEVNTIVKLSIFLEYIPRIPIPAF